MLETIIVYIHIITAWIFAMTLLFMQFVVSPGAGKITDPVQKKNFQSFIMARWRPIIDADIVILAVTGLMLIHYRWDFIGADMVMHVKTTLGALALIPALLLHFYYRKKKANLSAEGETEKLARLNSFTLKMERFVFVMAWISVLMGVYFNHVSYPLDFGSIRC